MMLQTEPMKQISKKESKPLNGKLVTFFNRAKYPFLATTLLLVTILVELLDLTIDGNLTIRNITIPFLVVTFTTYTCFFLLSDFGKSQGQKAQDYIKAKARYEEIREKIKAKNYNAKLKEFCTHKVKDEREQILKMAFDDSTITYSDYLEKYKSKSKKELKEMGLQGNDIKLIQKANTYKQVKLVPSMLWSSGSLAHQLSYITATGNTQLIKKRIIKAIRIIAMSLLVVSVGTAVALHWSWQILFEVLNVILNMFFGFRDGYESYAITDALSYESKSELLEEAYDWFEHKKN